MLNAGSALAEICPEMEAGKACELLGVKLEDVLAELAYRKRERGAKMAREMALAARAGGTRRIMREGETEAHVDAMFHPTSYHYWGQRLGYQCWDDPAFVAEYKRDNPESRVRQANIKSWGYRSSKPSPVPNRAPRGNPAYLVDGKPTTREDRLTIGGIKVPR